MWSEGCMKTGRILSGNTVWVSVLSLCLTLRQWGSLDWLLDTLITWWCFYFTFSHYSVLGMVTIIGDMGGGWKTRKWNLLSKFTKSKKTMGCKVKETCFNRENRVCRVTCWIYVQETKQVSRGHKPIINNHPMTTTTFQQWTALESK